MDALADIPQPQPLLADPGSNAQRIEELGRIIQAYSQVTEKLQQSHAQLRQTVQALQSELSEKNRQLERKKRLAALGEMAAGMAHEIRNPLGGIQLYASMLASDVQQQAGSLQLVNKISAGVKRLDGLVNQVLQFTREISAKPVAADLAQLVDQSMELAGARMHAGKIVCRTAGPRPMPVVLDPLLMGQAILNLLINAVEAVGDEGTIEIAWEAPEVHPGLQEKYDGPAIFSRPGPEQGQFRLGVRDSGPGIAPAVLERIFNPFFTTKEAGTGLGLAIVHRIVEAHEGTITVSNAPQGGAVFEIRI